MFPLTNRCHLAGGLIGNRHDTVKDGVDRASDIVLRVLVVAAGVVNRLPVSLLCWAKGAISAKLQGAGIAKVVPWYLTCECVYFALFDNACVAVGC